MPKVTLFYAQSDPLVTLNDLCPKWLKIYALSDPPAGFHWHDECSDFYVIDEISIGLRRVLTTAGSLGESSYWIYVGQVMGQWQQDFEDTVFF